MRVPKDVDEIQKSLFLIGKMCGPKNNAEPFVAQHAFIARVQHCVNIMRIGSLLTLCRRLAPG